MQNFHETPFDFESLFQDSSKDVNGYGDPNLGLHSVGRRPEKRLDSKMLFDPLEEKFDAPAAFVKPCHRQRSKEKIVCKKDESFSCFGIFETDTPQEIGIVLSCFRPHERDGLIASEPG